MVSFNLKKKKLKEMQMKHEEILKRTKDTNKAKDFFLEKLAFMIGPDRLKHLMEKHLEDFNLIDVRGYEDYIKGHIPYAVHIPFEQMEEQLVKLSKDKVNILYSHSFLCQKSKKAAYILADEGYPVMELLGGFKGWKKRDFDIIETDDADYPN